MTKTDIDVDSVVDQWTNLLSVLANLRKVQLWPALGRQRWEDQKFKVIVDCKFEASLDT